MKALKKTVATLMTLSMIICCFTFNGTAASLDLPDYTMSQAEWDAYWETVKGDNTQIALNPGSDETELNFNWHSDVSLKIPRIRISKNADMSDYTEFKGTSLLADNKQQTNRVTVTGLEENTKYYYSYSLGKNNWSEPQFYRTLSSKSFKALFISDVQCGAGDDGYGYVNATKWNKTLNAALKKFPDTSFILNAGDNTNSGKDANEWAATLAPKAMRNLPMATTIGNHDKKGSNYKYYVNNPNHQLLSFGSYTGTQYWFRYGDVLFVSLNSMNYNAFEFYNVVERAVAANPDAKWRVALFHYDVFGTGHHATQDETYFAQNTIGAVLDKFDFDIALNGHEHYYGRSYNMLNNEIVPLDYTKNYAVDPAGTLYITSASASGRNRMYDEPFGYEWLNFEYMSEELTYSELEFTESSFNIKTFTVDDERLIDEYTIEKTDFSFDKVHRIEGLLTGTDALDRLLKHFTGEFYVIFEFLKNPIKFAVNH